MKALLKKILSPQVLNLYHKLLAYAAAGLFLFPSRRLIVIGITGTKGKSSTLMLTRAILEAAGYKVGWTSTVSFGDGRRETPNRLHMTMPGRFFLSRWLFAMAKNGCQYALIEVTSEGIKQFRHLAINFDAAVFTNLAPEHLEAHGGLAEYRAAKQELFRRLPLSRRKRVMHNGKPVVVVKVSIVNIDSEYAPYFLKFGADHTVGFGILNRGAADVNELVRAEGLGLLPGGSQFQVRGVAIRLPIAGTFNVYNALAAIAIGLTQGVSLIQIHEALAQVQPPPGRLQAVAVGQPFSVFVDYAHTPDSLRAVYELLKSTAPAGGRLIGILGAAGGGRDTWKRPVLGAIAEEFCDEIVLTDEDPYDEDPLSIIHAILDGVSRRDKVRIETDRRLAMRYAFTLAKPRDTIIITGKGSEQTIIRHGIAEPWNDAAVAAEELSALGFRPQPALMDI